MNFSNITNWTIPEGTVKQVTDSLGRVIWEGVHDYSRDYFFIENLENSAATLTIKRSYASAPGVTVYKSTDQTTWTSMGNTTTRGITASIPANGKLYLKATVNAWGNNYYNYITADKNHNISGNIMSLIFGDNFYGQTGFSAEYAFRSLFFKDTKLISAENLVFPSRTYNYCYKSMFAQCTNLTTAPTLPAKFLKVNCYSAMFSGCSALTTAPALPATNLANYCYQQMFENCTSLTSSPVLNAATLSQYSYDQMFSGCSNLKTVTCYASNISATSCLNNWLYGVSQTGDFYNLGSPSPTYPRTTSGIPSGWTVHTSL